LTAQTAEPATLARQGAHGGALAFLWLLAAGALVSLVWTQPQRAWSPPPKVPVVLEGEHYRLDAAQVHWLEAFTQLHFSEGQGAARELLDHELGAGLEQAFDEVRERLPAFADWYYSLGGEYSRLAMAALAQLSLADGDFIATRAAATLFPEEEWEQALAGLDGRMMATLQVHHERLREDWLGEVSRRLAPARVPAPLDSAGATAWSEPLRLDGFIGQWIAEQQETFRNRVRLSTAAGGGVAAGTALWRGAAARTASASGRAIAARGAGRTAARAGAAASGGLAVCAASGPAAAGCALLAGAAAWLATDWALLTIDEHLNRDELLAALEAGLLQLKAQMHADMLAAFDAIVEERQDQVAVVIERDFIPAQAGR
jgi:hypothetical protein